MNQKAHTAIIVVVEKLFIFSCVLEFKCNSFLVRGYIKVSPLGKESGNSAKLQQVMIYSTLQVTLPY
jgi:hypothetical protein